MKKKRQNALGTPTAKDYLEALDRLGLPMPILRIDYLPKGDELDDWLTVVLCADLRIYQDGHPVAVLISCERYERLEGAIESAGRKLRDRE